MAVVFVKSLILPKDHRHKYTPLNSNTPNPDIEGASSEYFGSEPVNEKASTLNEKLSAARINPRLISDATIGLSDGLTVPFALTAGLSALGDTNVVIYGGFAELIAGGISMGLGGYLGAKSEAEAYHAALSETKAIVSNDHQKASIMMRSAFEKYDFPEQALAAMASSLLAQPAQMVDFLMRFHHQLAEADFAPSKAYMSGLTISLGYFFGGLIALLPYLFVSSVRQGFFGSVFIMAVALFVFGWGKTSLVGETNRWLCFKNGMQMMVLGGIAAGAAMGCVNAIGGE